MSEAETDQVKQLPPNPLANWKDWRNRGQFDNFTLETTENILKIICPGLNILLTPALVEQVMQYYNQLALEETRPASTLILEDYENGKFSHIFGAEKA
ncbi:MAG TPA: hypothetical protein VGA89_00550 [Patescibacteria group bacterium]|jgi:hypothetical protein